MRQACKRGREYVSSGRGGEGRKDGRMNSGRGA